VTTSTVPGDLSPVEQFFWDLRDFDTVHPNEEPILDYIRGTLVEAGIDFAQDQAGNVVAYLPGGPSETLALVAHVDIVAPLNDRQVIVEPDRFRTDGAGILGGDDRGAVAVLLDLAWSVVSGQVTLARPVELIFTVGEEDGCTGATQLNMALVNARWAVVMDWQGGPEQLIEISPTYCKFDIELRGLSAHPALWLDGVNAGVPFFGAASLTEQGEILPGVTCNIGTWGGGSARNVISDFAWAKGELRGYEEDDVRAAADLIQRNFESAARARQVAPSIKVTIASPTYRLDNSTALYSLYERSLAGISLQPQPVRGYAVFDGSVLSRYMQVLICGAAYHNPHRPDEWLSRPELARLASFVRGLVAAS
jgi:tripeptide aminopeptidase